MGFSPDFGWGKVHLGYRNVNFSPFTLSNKTFLGGGFEINPGKLRLGAVYGRFQRPVSLDSTSQFFGQNPAYEQTGYVTKIGVGTKKSYVDLIYLNIEDDQNSIDFIPENPDIPAQSNSVFSISSKLKLGKKVNWNNDVALSALTRDVTAPEVNSENSSFYVDALENIIDVNSSTNFQTAVKSEFKFRDKDFSLGASYERIEPEYKSLGTYYFNNDIERLTINPAFTFAQRKVRVNSRLGIQRDNIRETLAKSTLRTAIMVNTFITPNKDWQISLNYNNMRSKQEVDRAISSDTTELTYVNQNATLLVNRTIQQGNLTHRVKLNSGINLFDNQSQDRPDTKAYRVGLAYEIRWKDINLSLSPGVTLYIFDNTMLDQQNLQIGLRTSKQFLDKKLNTALSTYYITNSVDSENVRNTIQALLNASYKIDKAHTFGMKYRILNVSPAAGSNFNEGIGGVFYRVNLAQIK